LPRSGIIERFESGDAAIAVKDPRVDFKLNGLLDPGGEATVVSIREGLGQ
jgi:hypothetical protein